MPDTKLTKSDTVALWHAVNWMALCLRESSNTVDQAAWEVERERLAAAKRALRKVNAIRKGAMKEPAIGSGHGTQEGSGG